MQHISTVVVPSGGSSSITFMAVGDIPSEYTDLVLTLSARATHASVTSFALLSFNGSSASFSIRALGGNGSSAFSYTSPSNFAGEIVGNNSTSNTFSSASFYIPNYRSAVAKSFSIDAIAENNATLAQQSLVAGLWNVTDAITSVTLTPTSGNFMEFSSASLYGILAGSDGTTVVS